MSNAWEKVFTAFTVVLVTGLLSELDVRFSAFIHSLGQLVVILEWERVEGYGMLTRKEISTRNVCTMSRRVPEPIVEIRQY